MGFVLDSSVTVAWVIVTERTPDVLAVIRAVVSGGAVVPNLWHLEVANSLRMAERRGRISGTDRDLALKDMRGWAIEVDPETVLQAWSATIRLAEQHGLTLYDAAYVELADRRSLPLATLDRDMLAAARMRGIALCI